jgi:hypothetical protein
MIKPDIHFGGSIYPSRIPTKKPCKLSFTRLYIQVPRTGFEPAHPCERCDLNTVRLPISPPGQV